VTLLALLLAAQIASGSGTAPPEDLQPIAISTVPMARAFASFRAICLDTFPDVEAFDAAAQASDLGFARAEGGGPGEHRWVARAGMLIFNTERTMEDGRAMLECDFRFAIPDRLTARQLIGRIERALAPGRPRFEADGTAIWDLGGNFADRLNYFPASPDRRYFSLNRRHIFAWPTR
jgi:hypothetical protein